MTQCHCARIVQSGSTEGSGDKVTLEGWQEIPILGGHVTWFGKLQTSQHTLPYVQMTDKQRKYGKVAEANLQVAITSDVIIDKSVNCLYQLWCCDMVFTAR